MLKYCRQCEENEPLKGRRVCLSCLNKKNREQKKLKLSLKKFRIQKKKEKKKEKKENNPRLLKKKLDQLFSTFIRQRDKKCVRCGTTQNLQCSHIMSRVSLKLRWDERNALTLCYKCHLTWWHKEPLEASEWCKTIIGEITYKDLLKEKYEIKQWTIQELKDLVAHYNAQISQNLPPNFVSNSKNDKYSHLA